MTLAPGSADHWDTVYAENGREGVSWAQTRPAGSLAAVDALGLERDVSVIDVGGGASTFTAAMRQRGFDDLSVIDISRAALTWPGTYSTTASTRSGGFKPTCSPGRQNVTTDAAVRERAVGPGFTTVASSREAHVTPAGDVQYFTWLALRRAFRDRPPA